VSGLGPVAAQSRPRFELLQTTRASEHVCALAADVLDVVRTHGEHTHAMSITTAVVVGNPKPQSRTYEAAKLVVGQLTGREPDLSIDLVDFGASLLDWSSARVAESISSIEGSDLVVFASPTYKATYTGLLKLFLDRIRGGALAGVTAIPLMLGGDWRHSLAPEVFLKPVLAELGASCPTRGLFLLESEYSGSVALENWLQVARPQLAGATAAVQSVVAR
jgi:FMN reductase